MIPAVLLLAFVVDTSSPAFQSQVRRARLRQSVEQLRKLVPPSRRVEPEDMVRPGIVEEVEPDDPPPPKGGGPRKKIG